MKTIKVLDTLKIGDNTSVIVESRCEDLRNNMEILDSNNNKHNLLSIGMEANQCSIDTTTLLIKGNFNSGIIKYE